MTGRARLRLTGLLLALCLNAAFVAMFAWQARPARDRTADPSRMALVWAVPLVEAPAPRSTPRQAKAHVPARTVAGATAPVPAAPAIEPASPAQEQGAIAESDSADPFDDSHSALARSFDKAVMGKAITTAMAERQALEDTQKFVKSAPGKTIYEKFADDAEFATIPYCLGSQPMKHTPPVIEVGPVKIGLTSLLALPFFAKAVATGKCRIK